MLNYKYFFLKYLCLTKILEQALTQCTKAYTECVQKTLLIMSNALLYVIFDARSVSVTRVYPLCVEAFLEKSRLLPLGLIPIYVGTSKRLRSQGDRDNINPLISNITLLLSYCHILLILTEKTLILLTRSQHRRHGVLCTGVRQFNLSEAQDGQQDLRLLHTCEIYLKSSSSGLDNAKSNRRHRGDMSPPPPVTPPSQPVGKLYV